MTATFAIPRRTQDRAEEQAQGFGAVSIGGCRHVVLFSYRIPGCFAESGGEGRILYG